MKSILLLLWFIIIFSSFTYANNISSGLHYWSFNNDANDEIGSKDGLLIEDDSPLPLGNESCYLDDCFFYADSLGSGYIHYDNPLPDGSFSFKIWAKWIGTTRSSIVYMYDPLESTFRVDIDAHADDLMDYQVGNSGTICSISGTLTTLSDNEWHMITLIMNDDTNIVKVLHDNATYDTGNESCSATNFDENPNQFFPVGAIYNAPEVNTNRWSGWLDEMIIYEYALSDEEVQIIYTNEFNDFSYPYLDDIPPYINITYPINDTHYNDYNGSILININESGICSLNNTNWDFNGNETHFNFINNTHISNGDYEIFILCNDNHDNEANKTLFFTVDDLYPIISINSPINNSVFNDNFLVNVSYSDNNLLMTNTTIFYSNGTVFYNDVNISHTVTNYTSSEIQTIVSYTDGEYLLLAEAEDSHTFGSLKGLEYEINNKDIRFYKNQVSKRFHLAYYDDGEIKLINDIQKYNFDLRMGVNQYKSEYKFYMDFLKPSQDVYFGFAIEKTDNLRLINADIGHFIFNKWYIDFSDWVNNGFPVNVKEKGGYYLIYTNTKYCNVEIGERCILDPSIGGLNYINTSINFKIDTTNPYFISNISTVTDNSISLNITWGDAISINNWSIAFSLNNCSSIITDFGNDSPIEFIESGLSEDTEYFINVTIFDLLHNISNCFNFTTLIREEEEVPSIGLNITELVDVIERNELRTSSLWIGFIIFILFLFIAYWSKESIILSLGGLEGFFFSIYLFKNYPDISMVSSIFFGLSVMLFILGIYWQRKK